MSSQHDDTTIRHHLFVDTKCRWDFLGNYNGWVIRSVSAIIYHKGDISDIGPGHILKSLDAQTELLKSTRNAIAGSEESSLAGQLKLLRTDLNDQQRRDEEAREKFSELISKRLDKISHCTK
ncbi:MAG: hypothetical protein OXN26_15190 [Gammaproteobacteria bacterium]|nr:hypothetical protein [Gammaproteobacteria bacterium]